MNWMTSCKLRVGATCAKLTGRGGFSPPRKGERRNQDGRDNAPRDRYQPPNVKFDSHTNRYDTPMPDRRESFGRGDGRGELGIRTLGV